MALRQLSFPAAALAALCMLGCRQDPQPGAARYSLLVGAARATVEVAADPVSRMRGLSGRESLQPDGGMLFVFPAPQDVAFWMKDTHVPLSIAFIAPDGKIAEIQEMAARTLDRHSPKTPVIMALEMPAGWFERNGVRPGDAVVIPPELALLEAQ